jgi:hypothetical protein
VTDAPFVIAGWGVILGGIAVYAVALLSRLRRAREESLRIRHDAEQLLSPRDRE